MPTNWFIVQTGHAYGNTSLSDKGRNQIEKLRRSIVDGLSVDSRDLTIFYTPSKRGEETARTLGKKAGRIRVKELWTDKDRPKDISASIIIAHNRIMKMDIPGDNYIVVTDPEGAMQYPRYLSRKFFNQPLEFNPLLYGEAYWLSLDNEEWRSIPSDQRLYHSERVIVKG